MRYKRPVTPGTGSLVVGSRTDSLLARLRSHPEDPDVLRELTMVAAGERDFPSLLQTYEALAEANRDFDVYLLISLLSDALAEAAGDLGDKEASEYLIRAASLSLLHDTLEGHDQAAGHLAAAWERYPTNRILEMILPLFEASALGDMPDGVLVAASELGSPDQRTEALQLLTHRSLAGNNNDDAHRYLESWLQLSPEDPQALNLRAELGVLTPDDAGDTSASATEGETPEEESAPEEMELEDTSPEGTPPPDGSPDEVIHWIQATLPEASLIRRAMLRRSLFTLLRETGAPGDSLYDALQPDGPLPEEAGITLEEAEALQSDGGWDSALAHLEASVDELQTAEGQGALLREIARILEAQLSDPQRAENAYRRLRMVQPESLVAMAFYTDWLAEGEDPRRTYAILSQCYGMLTTRDTAHERVALALNMLRVATDDLQSPDKAIEAWTRVLADQPLHPGANEALRSLYTEAERWHALAEHLDRWSDHLSDEQDREEKVALLFELAALYQDPDRLPMDELVASTYQRISQLSPANERALEHLANRFEQSEQWHELISVLARKVEVTDDPGELIEIFMKIAELYLERMRSDSEAIPVLELILELDPENPEILRKLRRIHQRRYDSERLYETYQRELPFLEGAERLDVLVELARLAERELQQEEEAHRWWGEVLDLDARHEEALSALQTQHTAQGNWDSYATLLERRLEGARTRKQRVELLLELGDVAHTRLHDEERALSLYRQVCEISPFNSTARGRLRSIFIESQDWTSLRGLYEPRSDWSGYLCLLRDHLQKAEADTHSDLWVEIANAETDLLDNIDGARMALVAALGSSPDRVDVAQRLVADHGERLDREARRDALMSIARHHEDPAECEAAWRELAIQWADLGELEATVEALGHVLCYEADRGLVDGLQPLVDCVTSSDAWDFCTSILADALERLPFEAKDARVSLHRHMGHILRSRVGDADSAREHLMAVLEDAPGDEQALAALEEIYLSRTDFEGLESVLRMRADQALDQEVVVQSLRRLGQLYEDALIDLPRAARTYQEILELSPEDVEALDALRRTRLVSDGHEDLAGDLEDLIPRLDDPLRRQHLQLELASLYRSPLGQVSVAVDLLRELLNQEGSIQDEALAVLEAMFASGEATDAVAPILDETYRDRGDLPRLAHVLQVRLRIADTLDEQLGLIEELQTHYEGELANPSSAFDVVATRFSLDPDDESTWEDLTRLAAITGRWEALANLWRGSLDDENEEIPTPAGRSATSALKVVLAGVVRERLDATEEAITLYEGAVADADDPADCADVLDLLETLYEDGERLEDLVRIRLLASEAALDGERRRVKLLGACDILAGPLERPEDVLEHYELLAAEDPSDVEYADRLEGTYERLERWAELTEHLEKRAEALRTPEATDRLHFRGAMVRYKHLGELDGAIDDLLKLVPSDHVGDQVRQVLIDLCGEPEAMSESLRSTVIDTLQEHYASVSDPLGQAMVLEVQAGYSPPGMSRAHLLLEAAGHIREAWNEDLAPTGGEDLRVRAFDCYAEALREVPTSAVTLAALDEMVQQLERWEPYADLMVEVAEACPEPAIAVGLRHRAAMTIQEHLDNVERAVLAWESVLNSDRRHAGSYRSEALHALDNLYEKTERRGARVKVLQQLAELADRTMTRVRLLQETARLLHDLGRNEEAISTLQNLLREARGTRRKDLLEVRLEALTHLDILLTETRRHEELIQLLMESPNEDDEVDLLQLYRAAEIAEEKLQRPPEAIAIYQQILGTDPHDEIALNALDRLFGSTDRWEDKAALFDARLEMAEEAGDTNLVCELLFARGQLEEHQLLDLDRAVGSYAEALGRDPGFAPAVAALDECVAQPNVALDARRALADAHRRGHRPEALARVLEVTLAETSEPTTETGSLQTELAYLYLDALDAPWDAWTHAQTAYRHAPSAREGIERRNLAVRAGIAAEQRASLPSFLLEIASSLESDAATVERLVADVAMLREQGYPEGDLVPFWEHVLSVDPRHRVALDTLESRARNEGSETRVAQMLELRIQGASSGAESRPWRLELAGLLANQGDGTRAIEWLEGLRQEDPTDGEASGRLGDLYREQGRWEALLDLLEAQCETTDGGAEAALRLQIAEIAAEQLGDHSRAREALTSVLAKDPTNEDALKLAENLWLEEDRLAQQQSPAGDSTVNETTLGLLSRAYELTERWEDLVGLYDQALGRPMDGALREQTLLSLADVKAQRLDDLEGAYQAHRQLVESARDLEDYLPALEALAEEISAWGALVDFYESLVDQGKGGAALRGRVATLAYEVLDDLPRALTHQQALLTADPRDVDARNMVSRLLEESQQWEALVSHLRTTAESIREPAEKFECLVRAAEILEGELGRDTDAASLLQTAVELAPSAAETAEHLAELLIRSGDRNRLHAHYRSWIERSAADEAGELRMRLAQSLLDEPGTALSGVEELQDLITTGEQEVVAREALEGFLMDPERSGTRWRGAVEAAVGVVEATESSPLPARRRAAIAEALARVAPLGPDLRSARLEAAEAWEHAGEPGTALTYLDALLQQKADDSEVVDLLNGLAKRHGLWREVVALYETSHGRELPPALAAERAYEVARIHRDQLDDHEAAARWFERMLSSPAETSAEPHLDALEFLADYYEKVGASEDQARILEMWLLSAHDDVDQVRTLRARLASVLMDQLDRPEEALALLEADLQHVLSDEALLARAETLYRQTERFGPLVQLFDLGVATLDGSDQEVTELLERKLSVAEDHLGDAAVIREACDALAAIEPHHPQATDARERLAIREEDWASLDATLALRLDTTTRLEDRIDLLLRRAELNHEHLTQPTVGLDCVHEVNGLLSADAAERPRLVTALEALQDQDGDVSIEAARLLELHYRIDERWDDYAAMLRIRAEAAESPEGRREATQLLAETLETRLENPSEALATIVAELGDEGDPAFYNRDAQRLGELTGEWDELADAIEHRLKEVDAEAEILLLSPWLGSIARDQLGQPPRAARALERGLEVSPTNLAFLDALEPLYGETGEWHALQRIYGLQASAQSEEQRSETWRKLARLNETQLHDLGGAREAWTRLLEDQPQDQEALQGLLRIAERNEAWDDVDQTIALLLSHDPSTDERRSLLIRRARNSLEHLGDPTSTFTWVSESEAAGSTEDTRLAAVAIYEALLEHAETRANAANRLADYHEESQRWERVVQYLEIVAEETTDDERREALSRRIAEIQESDLGRPEAAFGTYLSMLRHDPRRLGLRPELERLAGAADAWSELASGLEAATADVSGGDKVALCLWLGRIYSDQLADTDNAIANFERVLEDEPHHGAALVALEGRYQERSDWGALVRILNLRLEGITSPMERVTLLRRVASIAEERLDDIAVTRTACDDILQLDPDDADALATLERLARKRDDWESLDLVLERRIAQAGSGDLRDRLLLNRADNALHNLHRERQALDLLCEADKTVSNPEDIDHLVDLYEIMLGNGELRGEISEFLAVHYERMERWDDLISALVNLLDEMGDGDEACRMALRIADISATHLRDPEGGLDILLNTFARFPSRVALRDRITQLAEAADAWHPVADTLSVALAHAEGGDDIASLGRWLASIRQERLKDARGAADALEKVLSVDQVNTEVMVALDNLYRELGQVDSLRRLLESRLAAAPDIERPLLLEDLALLAEKERGPMEALKLWRELIWERPDHQGARDALRRLLDHWETTQAVAEVLEPIYRREGMWEDLAVVLEHRLQAARDDEAAARIHEGLADLYDARLDDEARAFDHAARAMEVHGVRSEPLRRLERMARNLERWGELADVLERTLPPTEPAEPRVDCLMRVARLHEEHTHKADRALKAWRQVLEISPEHEGALAGLRRHQTDSDAMERLEVVTRLARVTTQHDQRADLWREVAELAHESGRLEEERSACEELLSLSSSDVANVDRLAEIYEATERYEDLVSLLAGRADEIEDHEAAAALHWRMGQIREKYLHDMTGAMGDYSEAWARDVNQRMAYTSLDTFYRYNEDWAELLSLLSSRAERTDTPEDAKDAWLEMASVAESRLGDVAESLRCYERAIDLDPECETAMDEMMRLYHKLDRVKALADLYERKAGLVPDSEQRCSYLGLAAELYANRLSRPERAEELIGSILNEMPEHPTARRVLAEIRISQGAYREAAELLEAAMGQMGDTHRVDALLHLGTLYGEHLDRPADALRAYEAARDLVPDHPDINQSLHKLYEQTGAWDGLRETLETEYERSEDPIARCGRALAVAKLYLEQLEDDEGFFAWIQLARDARRDSPEVAEALVSYHTSREEWEEAAPNLEWLVNYLDGKRLTHEIPRKAHHLAQILARMGDKDKALEYHKMAMQADGSYLPNLQEYGDLLMDQGTWDRAVRVYQNILLQRSNLEDEAVADVLERLSRCAEELGWGEEANQYRKRLHTDFPDRT